MRRVGCGLVVLIVLAGLALAGDQWVAATAERQAEENLTESLGTEADVELHGWPVGLRVLLGDVSRATVHAEDVRAEGGLRIAEFDAELTDVELPRDGSELPRASTAEFTAVIDEEAVRNAIGAPEQILSLRLREGVALIQAVGLEVEADVVARGGAVMLEPRDALSALLGLGSLRFDLSGSPGAPAAREVKVHDGRLVIHGVLEGIAAGEAD